MLDDTHMLTAGMAAGDEKAVELFYRRYFDWLYSQARRATGRDQAFCLDVVQDSVLRIIRTIRPVAAEKQLLAWMRLVAQTTALDALRAEQRRHRRETVLVAQPAEADRTESLESTRYEWLEQQIARFDPQLVRIIELRFEKRWTLARISRMLGLPLSTVDGRLRRAINQLRERAMEEFDD